MRISATLFKQTLNPPKKFIPLSLNPVTRWSKYLTHWNTKTCSSAGLENYSVGLEGCGSALNATGAIRTCRFFKTEFPPVFLGLKQWNDIEHIQMRDSDSGDVALFGKRTFVSEINSSGSIVAIENFTDRSVSVFNTRFPESARLVLGHENRGVSSEFLYGNNSDHNGSASKDADNTRADLVLYVPQYGTISSMNVVCSLGVALFYAFLDNNFPESRVLPVGNPKNFPEMDKDALKDTVAESDLRVLKEYQSFFRNTLPTPPSSSDDENRGPGKGNSNQVLVSVIDVDAKTKNRNLTPRVDKRPIHPLYYEQDQNTIREQHAKFKKTLLRFCGVDSDFFGLSVLYENDYDQRNFGGVIRNANVFLTDHIFYVGRKKINVVGAVGSIHYSEPLFCGPVLRGIFTADSGHFFHGDSHRLNEADNNGEDDYTAADGTLSEEEKEKKWFDALDEKISVKYQGKSVQYWLLDLGHQKLYQESIKDVCAEKKSVQTQNQNSTMPSKDSLDASSEERKDENWRCSLESYEWFIRFQNNRKNVITCCDTESAIRAAIAEQGTPVLLIVPQEGKLPDYSILKHCNKVLKITPDCGPTFSHEPIRATSNKEASSEDAAECVKICGLSAQVGSAIALQRLSSIMHPKIKAL